MSLPRRLVTKGALATLLISLGTITAGSGVALAVAGATTTHGITTVAGTGTAGFNGDNQVAVNAEVNNPNGVAEDLTGAIYTGDSADNRVRKVVMPTTAGKDIIATVAGNGTAGYSQNGTPATSAMLNGPTGVAVQSNGNIIIADTNNNVIRIVAGSTGSFYGQSMTAGDIYTVAGNRASCSGSTPMGDGVSGTSGAVCGPTGVANGTDGAFYFSDTGHNIVYRENKNGVVTPYAGNGKCAYSGDGGMAKRAALCTPNGLASFTSGTSLLFIADTGNSVVREVLQNGNIITFAGNGKFGFDPKGDGGPATKTDLNAPTGVGVDQSGGNVYITDTNNQRIRLVSGGIITTYAGNGTQGFSGDNAGDATQAELNNPTGSIAIDGTALYFADQGNERVRAIFNGPAPVLPETNWLILLPIGTGLILAAGTGFVIFRRRRRVTPTPAV
jgi:hypothetical protein